MELLTLQKRVLFLLIFSLFFFFFSFEFHKQGCDFFGTCLRRWHLLETGDLVIEEEQEGQLCGYCMTSSGCISARLCGRLLRWCRCSHYIGSKPSYVCNPQA